MTLNEKEILGQGFPWLSNRAVAFSHAQWMPGTWTRDARWLSPVKALKPPATSSVNTSQSGSPGDNCFKNCTFPSSWFEMSILLKEGKTQEIPSCSVICRGHSERDSRGSVDTHCPRSTVPMWRSTSRHHFSWLDTASCRASPGFPWHWTLP